MRLTNITRLRLPFGRLMGYDVAVSAPGRQLPISFDQQRHVGAGERPGSWMALTFTLPGPVPTPAPRPRPLILSCPAVLVSRIRPGTVDTRGPPLALPA